MVSFRAATVISAALPDAGPTRGRHSARSQGQFDTTRHTGDALHIERLRWRKQEVEAQRGMAADIRPAIENHAMNAGRLERRLDLFQNQGPEFIEPDIERAAL